MIPIWSKQEGQGCSLCREKPHLVPNYTKKGDDVETRVTFCLLPPELQFFNIYTSWKCNNNNDNSDNNETEEQLLGDVII